MKKLLLVVFFFSQHSLATVRIPKSLNQQDRQQVVRILGFGTAGKLLSDPYPLGGYSGLEVGVSIESIPVDNLSRLGAKLDEPQDNFTYPKMSIGKGFYNNIDSWIHFIPYSAGTGLSEYGGMARWCFFQAKYFPGTFSILVHGNATNIDNIFSSQNFGTDLITGIDIGTIGLYLGGGQIWSTGRFIGVGVSGITDSGHDELETVNGPHFVIGGSMHLQTLFAAVQIDIYTQPIFSSKFGVRF